MPTSSDGVLQAEFDPAWAAVRLIIDGGMWATAVDAVTITRQVAGEPDMPVRGVEKRPAIGGYFVGSDPEAPLGVPVTYRTTGYHNGDLVATTSVVVDTGGAATGMWIKVPGQPDLTVRAGIRDVSEVTSRTIGGVYQIAGGGGAIAQTTALWSGIETDRATVVVAPSDPTAITQVRAALAAGRVLLLQPVGTTDLDPGWYFIDNVVRTNPATRTEDFPQRWFTLTLQRTSVPAGQGQALAGVSWAAVMDRYPTWSALMAAKSAWFDVMQGV